LNQTQEIRPRREGSTKKVNNSMVNNSKVVKIANSKQMPDDFYQSKTSNRQESERDLKGAPEGYYPDRKG
jgi:hypothetical protein